MCRQMNVDDVGRASTVWKDEHYDRNDGDILAADDAVDKETDTFDGKAWYNGDLDHLQSKPFTR